MPTSMSSRVIITQLLPFDTPGAATYYRVLPFSLMLSGSSQPSGAVVAKKLERGWYVE